MERLTGEARDRVRASSLTLVVALTLVGVAIGLYATLVGSSPATVVPSEVVAVSADGRRLTVELEHGQCEEPAPVRVEEDEDAVVLTAEVTERAPADGSTCPDIGLVSRQTVTLAAPLGDRELRTAKP